MKLGTKLFTCLLFSTSLLFTGCSGDSGTHLVTFDTDGGSTIEPVRVNHGEKVTKPSAPSKKGYVFSMWTYNDREWSFDNDVVTTDITLLAKWRSKQYELVLANTNETAGSLVGAGTYDSDSEVTAKAVPNQGFSFTGWYDTEDKLVSNKTTYTLTIKARTVLVAKWTTNKNKLTVTSADTSKGKVSISKGEGYTGESVTVKATPSGSYAFKGWYEGDKRMSFDSTYTFTMPNTDYSLTANFYTKTEAEKEVKRYAIKPILSSDKKTITYGLYPQTNVNNSTTIKALEKIKTPENNGWYLYKNDYYAKLTTDYITAYQYFNNGDMIKSKTTYWFKCEPIVWDINASQSSSKNYVVNSSLILDHQQYINSSLNKTVNGETIPLNNYEYSDIRQWLINDFYNTAFCLNKSYIQENNITKPKTDKVTLFEDIKNCDTTDWARANGLFIVYQALNMSSNAETTARYWTSTADVHEDYVIVSQFGDRSSQHASTSGYGARPGIVLKLS